MVLSEGDFSCHQPNLRGIFENFLTSIATDYLGVITLAVGVDQVAELLAACEKHQFHSLRLSEHEQRNTEELFAGTRCVLYRVI